MTLPRIAMLSLLVLLLLSNTGWVFAGETSEHVPGAHYKALEILVKFKAGVTEAEKAAVRKMFDARLVNVIGAIRVELWRLPTSADTLEAVARLSALSKIDYAEPNYLYGPQQMPDDPEFALQWHLNNTGQTVNGRSGKPGADIDAAGAWTVTTGSREVVIAVIDSGVAIDHPDLAANIWTNPFEIPGNLEDDDGNGFVDDIHGWDFVNDDNNPSDYSRDLYGDGHGTHVAAIIAAVGNNAVGITGVMWEARIMPLQIFDLYEDSSFNATSGNIIRAVEYAVDNGARIINCSFGGPAFSEFQYDALSYADEKGVLVIAAAGNDRTDNDIHPIYPAGYDLSNIISVAATDETDAMARYSSYGSTSVHVAAPGGGSSSNIYSAAPPGRTVMFEDDFESGEDNWVAGGSDGTWSIAYQESVFGSRVAMGATGPHQGDKSAFLRTRDPIRGKDFRGLNLKFSIFYNLEPNRDFLFVELSQDGVIYEPIHQITGVSLGIEDVVVWSNDLEFEDFFLQFRLEGHGVENSGRVILDDICLTGIRWDFAGDEYGYKSGTSMAAPVVSGIAGLVLSVGPELSHRQVRQIILDTVDPIPDLANRVATGGRVNAAGAVAAALAGDAASSNGDGGKPVTAGRASGGGCFINAAGS
jgi:subtilisin family serine protease